MMERRQAGGAGAREARAVMSINESVAPLHPAAGRDLAADAGHRAGRPGRLRFLPLSALPQVDYPTIQVQTLYPGGSPR
jgi:hypothetical protein